MPNTTISIYLNDEDYVKYVQNKKNINVEVRKLTRELINKEE